jgi:hypothetical protein
MPDAKPEKQGSNDRAGSILVYSEWIPRDPKLSAALEALIKALPTSKLKLPEGKKKGRKGGNKPWWTRGLGNVSNAKESRVILDAQPQFPSFVPGAGIKMYSPWFPRQADHVGVTLEVLQINGATIGVMLFTKNSEDRGDGKNADSAGGPTNINANAVGRTTQEWYSSGTIAPEEMVRYRFEVTGTVPSDWVLFRMLAPIWFNAAKA